MLTGCFADVQRFKNHLVILLLDVGAEEAVVACLAVQAGLLGAQVLACRLEFG